MSSLSLTFGSLAHRFRLAAAALAAVAVMLTALSSWWLINQQQTRALHALAQSDAEYSATLVKGTLETIDSRMAELAESSIIASALVDSSGKEIYLTPFLRGIQRINGIPIEILFTDFEGKTIASNESEHYFNQTHIDWLKQRLEKGEEAAQIVAGREGPEVVAVELLTYSRTRTPEGALLYKFPLKDIAPPTAVRLFWPDNPVPEEMLSDQAIIETVDVPAVFQALGLRIGADARHHLSSEVRPQYAVIFLFAGILAIVVLVFGSRLALALTRDLSRLETFSRSVVTKGLTTQRAEESGSTEVASLARSFNHMLDRLYEQQRQMQDESRKLHLLANTIPQLAWIANADGQVSWYNDRWYEYTGTTFEQMQGGGWQRLPDPAMLPQILQRWKTSVATGQPFEMTFPLRSAGGQYRTFFTRAMPLHDAQGNIIQWFGTNTDVTSLDEAEKAVRESAERLREGLKAGRMVVWDWILDTDEIRVSNNVANVLGWVPDKASAVWEIVHPEDKQQLHDVIHHAIARRSQYECIVRMILPGRQATIWVDVRGTIICNGAGKPHLVRGICLDVTERKRAEEELRAADRRKDEFLAMLAHELRNPLAPISTAAQILKLVKIEDPRIYKMSEIIARQVEHMTGLVDDLLDVSRVTRGLITLDKTPLSLDSVVKDAVEQVKPLMEAKSHHLEVRMPAESVQVKGDRTRLVQVVTNILNNAGKYTPDGGAIVLQVRVHNGRVTLSVSDNGIGISSDLLPHIFDLFTQAERSPDRSQGGLGLGLSLVKSLVELHDGTVEASSQGAGKGSIFTVHLPLLAGTGAAPPREHSADTVSLPTRCLRILVVDDNKDAADSLAVLLEAEGHQVSVEYDAHAALARALRESPQVLLLDIGLPDLDGYALARRLRNLPQTTRAVLIALTGYGYEQDRERSRAAGFDYHFLKPVDFAELSTLLNNLSVPAHAKELPIDQT